MLLCGIIKPHALAYSKEILETLENASVLVEETKLIRYTQELVEVLYDHMPLSARLGIGRQLISLDGLALLLRVSSIERLLEIVGTESDPSKCLPGTIRARFGVHADALRVGDEYWWENAFHRPIDSREAKRDLLRVFAIDTLSCYK